MKKYFSFVVVSILLVPFFVYAYTSVISKPEHQAVVLQIQRAEKPQEFFGRLDGFPHTYTFTLTDATPYKASLFVPDRAVQKNDVSVIIVKSERRGVTEVGRTLVKEQSWATEYDQMLVERFRGGGAVESELQPGTYTLEVSSPNNEGKYRLVLGTEKIHRGYFDNLRVLFEVKTFLDNSKFTAIQSPLIYWPLLISIIGVIGFFIYKRLKFKSS